MKRAPRDFLPQARREGLVVKEVDNEVLVYDLERDEAHCLNLSAATIWRLCDGKTSTSGLGRALEDKNGARVDERVIWLGLQDLSRNHLLEDATVWPEPMMATKGMSRREAVRRIGVGAAFALPLVISITAPTPVKAAVSCAAKCKTCSTGSECCSGVCVNPSSGCGAGKRCA